MASLARLEAALPGSHGMHARLYEKRIYVTATSVLISSRKIGQASFLSLSASHCCRNPFSSQV